MKRSLDSTLRPEVCRARRNELGRTKGFDIALKRVYDVPSETDGRRILVERLWPRGLSKDRVSKQAV